MKGKITYKRAWNARGEREDVPTFWIDGKEVSREEFYAAFPPKKIKAGSRIMVSGIAHSCWPMKSKAFGVHRKQVAAANARNERLGLSTRYAEDGTAVIPDRAERRRLCKAEGFFDNDAGYGDFAGEGPGAYKPDETQEPDIDLNVSLGKPITE